jgi:hypothetical protein
MTADSTFDQIQPRRETLWDISLRPIQSVPNSNHVANSAFPPDYAPRCEHTPNRSQEPGEEVIVVLSFGRI